MKPILLITAILFNAPMLSSYAKGTKMLYGQDDRYQVVNSTPMRNSIMAQVSKSKVDLKNLKFKNFISLAKRHNLCADEKYAQEPSISECTSFVIGNDLIATAGHCLFINGKNDKENCEEHLWVMNYTINSKLSKSDLYGCKEVIRIGADPDEYWDYAIIRLDREIKGAQKLTLTERLPILGDNLTSIGFPLGAPMKVSPVGKYFGLEEDLPIYSLDLFQGNSGSPIINQNQEVFAIHIMGPSDAIYYDSKSKCNRYNRCEPNQSSCQKNLGFPFREIGISFK
ncbi:serine protease [Halobacteriovorax sp. JY17]|uniref:trypsin-like serine peptidase n=1 Tax=Halobacteriovorax sp. JY17 TaxID=2014617 RepID=UPI000C4A093D|nr:serine protease [Halobacteriovorax sp. JY17]PIK15236.1 MAG: hypothetical protein CES88_00565 [Halobacteriovorax sp. JY17]